MTRRAIVHRERTLEMAHAFLTEVRRDLERAVGAGWDLPPRLRTVHLRPGHATPEYRTLAIPLPPGIEGAPPEILSVLIARYTEAHPPACILLAIDGLSTAGEGHSCAVLIAEARDVKGTRLFWMQPYRVADGRITWGEAAGSGWQDPGEQELILDAAFEPVVSAPASAAATPTMPEPSPPALV